MDILTREEMEILMQERTGACVSVYLPTHRAGREVQQDPVRLRNLLGRAAAQLAERGLRPQEAEQLLEPAKRLLPEAPFWGHQSDGLALFFADGFFRHYRLPLPFPELAVAAERFHLKPLLPLLTGDGTYLVLALSQNEVRLFQGGRSGLEEIDLSGTEVPPNIGEALKYDDPEKQLQFHTGTTGAGGDRAAMFHGQGAGAGDAKGDIRRFFLRIDRGLQGPLRDRRAPLVLAGVDYLHAIYREVNTYRHLAEKGVTGSPREMSEEELHRASWGLVEPLFLREQEEAQELYRRLARTERASHDVRTVVPAAYYGKVEYLFVPVGKHQWGHFDPASNRLQLQETAEPFSEDLLDAAAVETYLHGGTVYAMPPERMPGKAPIAAVFRY